VVERLQVQASSADACMGLARRRVQDHTVRADRPGLRPAVPDLDLLPDLEFSSPANQSTRPASKYFPVSGLRMIAPTFRTQNSTPPPLRSQR
jgi:hypothetical protein